MKTYRKNPRMILGIAAGVILVVLLMAAVVINHSKGTNPSKEAVPGDETDTQLSEEEYYEKEEALDESEDNVLYEEDPAETGAGTGTETGGNNGTAGTTGTVRTEKPYYIKVNRQANCVTVYGKDESGAYTVPVKAMVCSVGQNGRTPKGVFKTSTKYAWRALYGGVYGQYAYRIHGAILFHSVPYISQTKDSLEYEEYNKLGQAASLGCVRLSCADAKWLIDNCPSGTTVEIYDSIDPGPLGKPSAAFVDPYSPNRGWDPTDPDENNPWKYSSAPPTISQVNAPTIFGVKDLQVGRTKPLDLLAGVYAIDSLGNIINVTVSPESVDVTKTGLHHLTYTAVDCYGNRANVSAVLEVLDTTPPTIRVEEGIVITKEAAADIRGYLLDYISAEDSGTPLGGDDIVLEISELENGINGGISGSYTCSAYAIDATGNESANVTFTVLFQNDGGEGEAGEGEQK